MTALAMEISTNTKIVTDFLLSKGLAAPSFDVNGLIEFPISPEDKIPSKARMDLIAATKELHDIALGPKEGLRDLTWNSIDQLSLQAVYEFKVASAVPLSDSISYIDLAQKVSVPMLNLRRLLRHAMTNHIFSEPIKGFVSHTSVSRLLLDDNSMNAWVGFIVNDCWLPIANVVKAMKKWPGSGEPTETGVNLAYGTEDKFFDIIQKDQELAKRFSMAMEAHGGGEGFLVKWTVEGYPWGSLGEATVVDMGGSQGFVSFAIAEAFPSLKFIVQDTAGMRTSSTIGTVPEALTTRVSLTAHDFLTPQTVVADIYFFRWIFHNYSDKYGVQILRALIPALKKGAKVVINDGTLPEPGTAGYVEEKAIRTMDMMMQVLVNAREREVDGWAELFREADERFKFLGAWKPEKSRMWFIEAEWNP